MSILVTSPMFRIRTLEVLVGIKPFTPHISTFEGLLRTASDGWARMTSDVIYEGEEPSIQYIKTSVVTAQTAEMLKDRIMEQFMKVKDINDGKLIPTTGHEIYILVVDPYAPDRKEEGWLNLRST